MLDCFRSENTNWWVRHPNSSALEEETKKKLVGEDRVTEERGKQQRWRFTSRCVAVQCVI